MHKNHLIKIIKEIVKKELDLEKAQSNWGQEKIKHQEKILDLRCDAFVHAIIMAQEHARENGLIENESVTSPKYLKKYHGKMIHYAGLDKKDPGRSRVHIFEDETSKVVKYCRKEELFSIPYFMEVYSSIMHNKI